MRGSSESDGSDSVPWSNREMIEQDQATDGDAEVLESGHTGKIYKRRRSLQLCAALSQAPPTHTHMHTLPQDTGLHTSCHL